MADSAENKIFVYSNMKRYRKQVTLFFTLFGHAIVISIGHLFDFFVMSIMCDTLSTNSLCLFLSPLFGFLRLLLTIAEWYYPKTFSYPSFLLRAEKRTFSSIMKREPVPLVFLSLSAYLSSPISLNCSLASPRMQSAHSSFSLRMGLK